MTNSKRGGSEKAQLPKTVLTTPQVAEKIGVAEGTVRSWLSRHTCFVEGHHYIKEDSGRTLWLEAGIELLSSGNFDKPEIEPPPDIDVIEPLLEASAQRLAYLYFEKLPQRVVEKIRIMLQNPTDQDKEIMQQAAQNALQAGATHLIANATLRRLEP